MECSKKIAFDSEMYILYTLMTPADMRGMNFEHVLEPLCISSCSVCRSRFELAPKVCIDSHFSKGYLMDSQTIRLVKSKLKI